MVHRLGNMLGTRVPRKALLGLVAMLCMDAAVGQQSLSPAITPVPPFKDPVLHGRLQRIILHMDAFHADSAMTVIGETLRSLDPERDVEPVYYLLTYRAEVLYYEGLFNEAMQDLDHSMKLAVRMGDSLLISNVYNLRGLLHENIQDSRQALPNLYEALRYYPHHPKARYPVSELYHIHGNLGSYLMNTGALDSAAVHLQRSLLLATQAHAHRAIAVAYWSLGNLALHTQDPDSARSCFLRSREVADAGSDRDVAIDALIGQAHAEARMGDTHRAMEILRDGEAHLKRHRVGIGLVTRRNFEREASRLLQHLGRPEEALSHMAEWHRIDSLITARNIHSALATQADLLRSEAQVALERVQAEQYADALERMRVQRTTIAVGSALGLLVILGSYLAYRNRQRNLQRLAELEVLRLQQEKTIAELRIREQVGRDMHDDLGAGLSALKLRCEMTARLESDPLKREQFMHMAQLSGNLIGSMRQIIWAMNNDQGSLGDLVAYVTGYARNYLAEHGLAAVIDADGPWPLLQLSSAQRRNLFLVVKEALHNVVKHAEARSVHLSIRCNAASATTLLDLVITDDGKGMDQGGLGLSGNGLRNIQNRLLEIGGEVVVDGSQGTTIRCQVPLPMANKSSIAGAW